MKLVTEANQAYSSGPAPTPDLVAVKARQQETWASGDYAVIGTTLQIVGESLCEAAELEAGSNVIDVACGNGNATLAAARRGCRVTGVDYVPSLLERARQRATAEGLAVTCIQGDAEALPFADATFDVALSTFGIMFTADQERAAREIARVVRPGGTIALANWTPAGFIGGLFATIGKHVPPRPGVPPPIAWGDEARLRELFPGGAEMRIRRQEFVFRYESADHFIDTFRRFYGPIHRAYEALPADGQDRLTGDLRELVTRFRRPSARAAVSVPGEYLEVLVRR
jgi:SAM-dependent methyltransferase